MANRKNKLLVILAFATFAISANAAVITSSQLTEYDKSVKYLDCIHGGYNNCQGVESQEQARANLIKYKNMDSSSFTAVKKAKLDSAAGELLLRITVEDAKKFMENAKSLTQKEAADLYADGAKMNVVSTQVGEDTLYALEQNNLNDPKINTDLITSNYTSTKEDLLRVIKQNESAKQDYHSNIPYLNGVEFDKEISKSVNFISSENGALMQIKDKSVEQSKVISTETTMEYITNLRRYVDLGYAIKIAGLDISIKTIAKQGVYDPNNKMEIVVDSNLDITKQNIDEGWMNRYKDIEDAAAEERDFKSNYIMLEFGIDRANEYYAKAAAEEDSNKKQKLMDKAKEYYTGVSKYYDGLAKHLDKEGVSALRAKYLTINKGGY